jgi:hypothetical protein
VRKKLVLSFLKSKSTVQVAKNSARIDPFAEIGKLALYVSLNHKQTLTRSA